MEIIDDVEKLFLELNYIYQKKYPDNKLDYLYNYWNFFNEYEEELKFTKNMSLETILYSKYYWFSRLADRFYEVYGFDAGIEQQQFIMIEEMDQRLDVIDWDFVKMLESGMI